MAWWRRARQEPEPSAAVANEDVSRLVDEGLLIALAAIRMGVKNELILRTLRDGQSFDRDELLAIARDEIAQIVEEKTASARALRRVRARASRRHGNPRHGSDYGPEDLDALERRRRIDLGIAKSLSEKLEDDEYLGELVDQARNSAMDEMFRPWFVSFASSVVSDADDEERNERLADLTRELQQLEARAEAAAAEADKPSKPLRRAWSKAFSRR